MIQPKILNYCLRTASLILVTATLASCGRRETSPIPVRIGWQVPQVYQGQLVQVLKRTTVLDQYSLGVDFLRFTSVGALKEAAEAGEVDVVLMTDQSAAKLLSSGSAWTIIARLAYDRVALYVPLDSPIQKVADLKGKTVGMPSGSAAQRTTLKAIRKAGLDPQKDVLIIDLDIDEQSGIVQKGSRSGWGRIAALAGSDPTPAILEINEKARILNMDKMISLILVSDDFLNDHPEIIPNILAAFMDAHLYLARYPDLMEKWFQQETDLELDPRVLKICASVEPNYRAMTKGQVSLNLSELDFDLMQEAADFAFEQGMVKERVDMRQHVNQSYLRRAEKKWWRSHDKELQIRKTK